MHVNAGDRIFTYTGGVLDVQMTEVNQQFCMDTRDVLETSAVQLAGRNHPRGVTYYAPASLRAAAHAITHPDFTLTGFAALALYGLPFFADACDTVMIGPSTERKRDGSRYQPTLIRGSLQPDETWHLRCQGRQIPVATPALAVVQALKLIRKEEVVWPTVPVQGKDATFVRAVQLVDAARRFTSVDPEAIVAASHQKLDSRWVKKVIAASSRHADSPKETEMRLLAQLVADHYGLTLAEQVLITKGDQPITRLDLAFLEPKVGLMYDGAHHWDHQRRQKDAWINLETAALRWIMLRFASETLATLPETLGRLFDQIL